MNLRILFLLSASVAACDKKPTPAPAAAAAKMVEPPAPAAAAAADPACAAKVKQLEPWLAQLDLEARSHEIDFGYTLQPIDRAPMPVTHHVDNVAITRTSIAAFDVSEHDHARNELGDHPAQKALDDRLVKIHDMKAGADEIDPAPDDLIRIDVDQRAAWGDVARALDAATKAGYHNAVFAFTAKSTLAQPPGVDATTTSETAAREASDKLDALQNTCKPWSRAALHAPARNVPPADDAANHAKAIAAALVECNCAADPDEIRRLSWIDGHWHQALVRVGVTLPLDPAATTTIALPAKTPWSEAHAKIVEAGAQGAVKLAAK